MSITTSVNIFGASSMGYALIESNQLERWSQLLREGLGLHLASSDNEHLAFRMDDHQKRLIIQRGHQEDFIAVGWQVRDRATLDEILSRCQRLGIAHHTGTPEESAFRGVRQFWTVIGPKNIAIELFHEPLLTDAPLNMLSTGFITGDSGMGHLALTTRKPAQMRRFWESLFDARHSDHIVAKIAGVTLDIDFLRVNERHHSIAIAQVRGLTLDPIRTRVQHMNLLTRSATELTDAFVRCRQLGFEMAHEIGEHPNDREQSFYVLTPSGFELELGWNAITVDESTWNTTSYQGISLWGHRPEKTGWLYKLSTNLANFIRAIKSIFSSEFSPL